MEKQKKPKRGISIKWKLIILLMCFSAALIIMLWLFQVVFLDSFYKSIKVGGIRSCAGQIEKAEDYGTESELIWRLAGENDSCIMLLNLDGTEIYSADRFMDCVIHKMSSRDRSLLINKAEETGEWVSYAQIRFVGGRQPSETSAESIIYVRMLDSETAVLINARISPVDSTVQTLRVQLYYITGALAALSVILALVISKLVDRPIKNLKQSVKQLAAGNYDITFEGGGYKEINELTGELNNAAGEISRMENKRRELIANVSHDLRTPLTLISGYAEAMRDLPDENNPENAQIIIDEAKRLTEMVHNLLDLSRLQAGAEMLRLEKFNLTGAVGEVVERMRQMTQKEGYVTESNQDVTVVLDCNLTPELLEEGFVREIISKIQTMRKDSDFQVTDRIKVYVTGNAKIAEVMEKNADEIKRVVLGDAFVMDAACDNSKEWNINGEKMTLGVSKK